MTDYIMKAKAGVFKLRLNLTKLIHKRPGFKRFLKKVYVGFVSSGDIVKHPNGVIINRVVDRENDYYEEEVTDVKTEKITRSVQEPLSKHVSKMNKSNQKGSGVVPNLPQQSS